MKMNHAQNAALKIARFHPRYKAVKPTCWDQVKEDIAEYKNDAVRDWDSSSIMVRRAYVNIAIFVVGLAALEIAIHFAGI